MYQFFFWAGKLTLVVWLALAAFAARLASSRYATSSKRRDQISQTTPQAALRSRVQARSDEVTLNFGLSKPTAIAVPKHGEPLLGCRANHMRLPRDAIATADWRAPRPGSYRRWASSNVCRCLVLPFAQIHDLPQQGVFSPRQVAHFNHHLRSHPMHSRQHQRRSEPAV